MRWPEKGDQLMKLRRRLSVWCAALVLVLAGAAPSTAADQRTYTNPLMSNFADAFSDPGIIRAKDGYWSYLGTDVLTRPRTSRTADRRTTCRSREAPTW